MTREEKFGEARRFILQNNAGMEVSVLNYGGIIQSIRVPDRDGKIGEVTLGFDRFEDYLGVHPYFGAIVGRFANRIAGGKFMLDGVEYQLAVNNGPNHLHGGLEGFDKKYWDVEVDGDRLVLRYLSRHMEEGFPGQLSVQVSYRLSEENEVVIAYEARTDRPTIINLTNHTYFNLGGDGDVLDHELMINADEFTPVDEYSIPTGEYRKVSDSPFDFRSMKAIGASIEASHEQLKFGGGYDHNFILREPGVAQLAARVYEPRSGRILEVYTNEPGIQLYTGNYLEGNYPGKNGLNYGPRSGFCLETQHFPDSVNQAGFPSVVLREREDFQSTTIYKFGAQT